MINGDSSKWKVKVIVQDRKYDPVELKMTDEWVNTEILELGHPGQLLTRYLTSTRRLVIEENGSYD